MSQWFKDLLGLIPKPKINWKSFWHHVWNEGTIALLMAATSYPIAAWQYANFNTGFPKQVDLFFSVLSGLALDMMIVKVATGPRTHPVLLKSWNFWAPFMAYLASCFILYDKYNGGLWEWKDFQIGSIVHLWYPTATFATAMYMSRIQTHESDISSPLQSRINELLEQIKVDAQSFADRLATETKGLRESIADYIRKLSEAAAREESLQSRIEELRQSHEAEVARLSAQVENNQSHINSRSSVEAELTTRINRLTGEHSTEVNQLTGQINQLNGEVNQLNGDLRASSTRELELTNRLNQLTTTSEQAINKLNASLRAASTRELELTAQADELRRELTDALTRPERLTPDLRVVQPSVNMKDEFRQRLTESPQLTNAELFELMDIPASDPKINSYRSMISDIRKRLQAA